VHSTIIFVAKYFIFLSIFVVAVFWLRASIKTKTALGWRVLIGGIIALALAQIGSHLYYDTRPFVNEHIVPLIAHAPDNGFPSDHVLLASFLGFVVLRYSRVTGLFLLLIAVLIGWARVEAHIHHPIDIIGSFLIAALAVALVQLGAHLWRTWHSNGHHQRPVV
jgi:undecaprenyl-diphosphatase